MPIQFNLARYLNPVFLETGTAKGNGVQSALNSGFKKIYSIEIVPELYEQCCKRFSREIARGKVELILGDSSKEIENILVKVDSPITFWLDAHNQAYNMNREEKSEKGCTLYEELELISRHSVKSHTILIDDIRLIRNKLAWGGHEVDLNNLIDRIKEINKDYNIKYENGYERDDVLAAYIKQNNVKQNQLAEAIFSLKRTVTYRRLRRSYHRVKAGMAERQTRDL